MSSKEIAVNSHGQVFKQNWENEKPKFVTAIKRIVNLLTGISEINALVIEVLVKYSEEQDSVEFDPNISVYFFLSAANIIKINVLEKIEEQIAVLQYKQDGANIFNIGIMTKPKGFDPGIFYLMFEQNIKEKEIPELIEIMNNLFGNLRTQLNTIIEEVNQG